MLITEPKISYIVYPSWADPGYTWEELPDLMHDPLSSRFAKAKSHYSAEDWVEMGYPLKIQPYELIDGPVGGGIIRAHVEERERWLPKAVIIGSRRSEWRAPRGTENFKGPPVSAIQPRDEPGAEFGLGKRAKVFECFVSAEHTDAAGDRVFWVLGLKRGRSPLSGIDSIPTWAHSFGADVVPLSSAPPAIQDATASWFVDPQYEYRWFKATSDNRSTGYNLAVVLYVALHLRSVAGPRVRYMHLVAGIDTKANARPYWTKR